MAVSSPPRRAGLDPLDDGALPTRPPRSRAWLGVGAVVLLAGALRTIDLDTGLPLLTRPDEPTVVTRAVSALGGEVLPPAFDWPPLSSYLLAGVFAVARFVDPEVLTDQRSLYLVARWLFVGVALAAVALTGALGARLADGPRSRATVAVGAAATLGVSYVSVRLGRIAHPEHLQLALVVGALLAACAFDRSRSWWPLALAGGLAGLAGATKYLGIAAGLPALAAIVAWRGTGGVRRAGQLAVLAAAAAAGVLAGTLGTVLSPRFVEGFAWQWRHQAGGHLGYEAQTSGWVFHATTSMPGNWGWPMTILAVIGVVVVAIRGTRPQRLTALLAVALYVVIGASRVAFPHYILLVVPLLAPLAVVALVRLAALVHHEHMTWAAGTVLTIALAVPFVDTVRYVETAGASDTRLLAITAIEDLPARAWFEGHTIPPSALRVDDVSTYSFGTDPSVLECDCFAVLSSYMEDRYRRRPDLYANEIGVYDAIRTLGDVREVVAPTVPLSYRWDLLPQWGPRGVPLRNPLAAVGPTITIVDLRKVRITPRPR